MASYYSVIQFVPDTIADERINIGVIVFDDFNIENRFTSNWNRVYQFNFGQDIDFLKDFALRVILANNEGLLFPGDVNGQLSRKERLLNIANSWNNCIQFTTPKGGLLPTDELLEAVVKDYLK